MFVLFLLLLILMFLFLAQLLKNLYFKLMDLLLWDIKAEL